MLRQLVGKITLCGIRLQLGQDVPDSGQKHPAYSDNRFLVPTAGFDSAVAFPAFRVPVGFYDGICYLNQQRLQIAASSGDSCGLHFLIALVISRTASSPGSQVLCRGKYRHINADLGDKGHSRQRSGGKARNRADQFQLVRIGLSKPEDFSFDEAIIDQETFDNVQRIRANVRRYPDGWGEAHPLTGLMYCADCGGKMYVHRVNNGKRDPQFTCSQYSKIPCGTLCGTQHRIRAEAVLTLITDMLRAIAEYSKNDRAEFIRTVQETQAAQQTADIAKKRKRLAAAQKRAGELERLICKIYEDNALGKLPDARYEALDAQYAKEQDALNAEITELEKAVTGYEQSRKSAEKFIALIDKYENFDTLTNTMLNEFVEKILVHERARKGSQDTTQEVEIYFNFVGRYIPPALQPVPLTPEEQEELRKKEERKDRLHQNYLRRKANGKQKEWEERYNAKRKAQVEAAKAAIRAEDMEKGIFITVSQLPKQEPRKATLPASAAV